MRKTFVLVAVFTAVVLLLSGCSQQERDQRVVREKTLNRGTFIPKNDIEFHAYNKRQERADDPTAILWCTTAFPIPASPIFTVPIVGKLVSGDKKPLPTDANTPGPDGMYGHSNPYEYGFTPTDAYAEFRNMPVYCTDQPTVWQRQETKIAMPNDPQLMSAHTAAREALKANKPEEANRILSEAILRLK